METGIRARLTPVAAPAHDNRELRRFGLTSGTSIMLMLGVILPLLRSSRPPVWPFVVGVILMTAALLIPAALAPLHKLGTFVVNAVRVTMTFVVMLLLFVIVITPAALILRLARRDPMSRRVDKQETSYRIAPEPPPANHLERPF